MSGRQQVGRILEVDDPELSGVRARQTMRLKQGLEQKEAKDIVKRIKDTKLKVQAQIQGEKVRVTGKKRDDLQSAIAAMKEADFGIPLQFTNFRD